MPFYPGSGIGGHCIPCDPLYLSWKAKKVGFKTKMIDLASYINRYMPAYVVKRVKELLRSKGISLKNSYVLILGVTYKKDVKDLREAPALDIIEKLRKEGANVAYFDPLIPYIRIPTLNLKRIPLDGKRLRKYDCVVIVTDHSSFNYDFIRRNAKLIFDTRWVYKKNFPNVERL